MTSTGGPVANVGSRGIWWDMEPPIGWVALSHPVKRILQ